MFPWENNGQDLPMRNNNSTHIGASLLEIIFACVILALAIIPIYRAISSSAEAEIQTTKMAMAKEILNSMRQEILSHPFDDITSELPPSTPIKTYVSLEKEPYPRTLEKILEAQKKYKDFKLEVQAQFNNNAKSVIQIEGKVTFTISTPQGVKPKSEILTFIQVKD